MLGCGRDEAEILARRASFSLQDYTALLFGEGQIEAMLIDTGFGGAESLTLDQMRKLTGSRVEWILRLETLAQELILASSGFDEFAAKLGESLSGLRAAGLCR